MILKNHCFQGTAYIKMKLAEVKSDLPPITSFLSQEFHFGVSLVQTIHTGLSAVTRVIKGAASPTTSILQLVNSVILGKVCICYSGILKHYITYQERFTLVLGQGAVFQDVKSRESRGIADFGQKRNQRYSLQVFYKSYSCNISKLDTFSILLV